jgi:hypothetical protein
VALGVLHAITRFERRIHHPGETPEVGDARTLGPPLELFERGMAADAWGSAISTLLQTSSGVGIAPMG